MNEKQKWLRIEESGWQIIIPDIDTRPHSLTSDKEGINELAGFTCPCQPEIDYMNRIIIHNSFEQMEIVDRSIRENIK